jgi:hypothetical protein
LAGTGEAAKILPAANQATHKIEGLPRRLFYGQLIKNPPATQPRGYLVCVSGSMLEIEPATEVNKKWIYAYDSYAKLAVIVIF